MPSANPPTFAETSHFQHGLTRYPVDFDLRSPKLRITATCQTVRLPRCSFSKVKICCSVALSRLAVASGLDDQPVDEVKAAIDQNKDDNGACIGPVGPQLLDEGAEHEGIAANEVGSVRPATRPCL